ncbi:hypothetical protein C8Q80DRAFT_1100248 [Daedaleopsis nitida]|nr:hypothetical protein C8Q80DRAFT_1100248 [Daedaleopsis nitida]
MYRLCGIIYFTPSHFVCRFIDKSGGVWYHDGAENDAKVLYNGNMVNWSGKKLQEAGKYKMSILLYTKL